MGESSPHWAASNYRYLFVQTNLCILFISDYKPSFSNRAEIELKYTTGLRENLALAFYHIDSWYLVPFSSNVSCDSWNKPCLCFDYRVMYCQLCHWMTQFEGVRSGIHSKKILIWSPPSGRDFLYSNAWQSEWGFTVKRVWSKCWMNEMQSNAKIPWEGNESVA
jgi:hypothetical protein